MGYATDYKLSIEPATSELDRVVEAVALKTSGRYSSFEESCNWYEHDQDMKAVSKVFPHLLLVLDGSGEESGDIWRKIYLDGELVFEWQLDPIPPSIPSELLERVQSTKQARIATLKEELQRLKKNCDS